MTDPAPVAVCIVTNDSAPDLPGCLACVGALRPRPSELVIVDCASQDRSVETARAHAPEEIPLVVQALERNLGFAGGMNEALAASQAPFVLSLNADARPEPDFLEHLVRRAEGHPRVGAVAARLVRPGAAHGTLLDACGMYLTPTWRHLDRGSDEPERGQFARAERVFGATGAASLFRRAALAEVAVDGDCFLSEFHSFREDAELCFRLRERGWEVLYEPAARAEHRRTNLPGRRRQMTAAVNCHSLKNRYLLRLYHQTSDNLLLTLVPCLWRELLIVAYVLLLERTSLAAYRWLWRNRRWILERRRKIRSRRTSSRMEINRWFFRRSLPL